MEMFRIWYSTMDHAKWLVKHTSLQKYSCNFKKLAESDASTPAEFHKMPGHLKNILYLDAPDLIVEKEGEPLISIEISTEAGTGHNAFQRFARVAAAVENGVPAIYIYPEATFIRRKTTSRWDRINPKIFFALERLMQIYNIPALLFYYPTYYRSYAEKSPPNPLGKGLKHDHTYKSSPDSTDPDMRSLFELIDLIVDRALAHRAKPSLINERIVVSRRDWMRSEYYEKGGHSRSWSPQTSTFLIPTEVLLNFLKCFVPSGYIFGDLLTSRKKTLVYKVDAKFRGDPYPGALAALDYMECRVGPTYEDRDKNLVIAWGDIEYNPDQGSLLFKSTKSSINDFIAAVHSVRSPNRCLLHHVGDFSSLRNKEIPRYYMQARYGCTFTKVKHIRVYAFFADAILFHDGALWREG